MMYLYDFIRSLGGRSDEGPDEIRFVLATEDEQLTTGYKAEFTVKELRVQHSQRDAEYFMSCKCSICTGLRNLGIYTGQAIVILEEVKK